MCNTTSHWLQVLQLRPFQPLGLAAGKPSRRKLWPEFFCGGPQKDEDGNTVSEPAMASKSRQFEMCWNCGQLLAVIVLLPLVAADSDIPHAE